MTKEEASALLIAALRPQVGSTRFKVSEVNWNYTSVTFELESVDTDPPIVAAAPLPAQPESIDF